MLVTLGVVRVEAGRIDRQLDCRLVSQVECAVVALEPTLDGDQAPERPGTELDPSTASDRSASVSSSMLWASVGCGVVVLIGVSFDVVSFQRPGVLRERLCDLVVVRLRAGRESRWRRRRGRRAPDRPRSVSASACARRALGRPAAQLGLVRLSNRGQRDLVDDLDVLGGGGALGHVVDRPGLELVGSHAASACEGDERDGHLAGVRVGPADGGRGGDRRVLEQRILDRGGIDVVTAADDQVLGAAGEPDESVASTEARSPVSSQPSLTLPSACSCGAGVGCGRGSRRRCSGRAARASRPRPRAGTSTRRSPRRSATVRACW